jgi:uncharacterized protein (TIGR02271 family)
MPKGFMDKVREGMDVFDAKNEKVGTLAETSDGYMRVTSGFLGLGKEYDVPLSAIRDVQADEIHLNVSKDRLDELESDAARAESDEEFDGTPVERTVTTTTAVDAPPRRAGARLEGQSEQTLQLREEELTARKHAVETGKVTLNKEVVSEQQTLDVPVTHEEVTIERYPVDRRASDRPISESGQTISVPVHEEQVRAEKQTVVYEEVGLDKRAVQQTEHVSDTVRREQVVIDKDGDVDLDSDTPLAPPTRPR